MNNTTIKRIPKNRYPHITLLCIAPLCITIVPYALADNTIGHAPPWSTPARGSIIEQVDDKVHTVVGSKITYTQAQIDNKFSAPDWFPNQHAPMPSIVQFGKKPTVWACASCHLASGGGHPESATLAGLSSKYIQSQMQAFAQDTRLDYSGHMNRMAKALSNEEIKEIADWFATLPVRQVTQVKESALVPKTFVDGTRMRLVQDKKIDQGINARIIEVPLDHDLISKRHPNSQFISYVPLGSIKRGKNLVVTGASKTIPCASCHGQNLEGSSIAPKISASFSSYTVRQLHGFKAGTRHGAHSALMIGVVNNLTNQDIVDIAAYLSSLSVEL